MILQTVQWCWNSQSHRKSGAKNEMNPFFLQFPPLYPLESSFWQEGNVFASKEQAWYAGLILSGSWPSEDQDSTRHSPSTSAQVSQLGKGAVTNCKVWEERQELVCIWISRLACMSQGHRTSSFMSSPQLSSPQPFEKQHNINKYLIKTHYFPDTVLSLFYITRKASSVIMSQFHLFIYFDFIKNELVKFFLHAQCLQESWFP